MESCLPLPPDDSLACPMVLRSPSVESQPESYQSRCLPMSPLPPKAVLLASPKTKDNKAIAFQCHPPMSSVASQACPIANSHLEHYQSHYLPMSMDSRRGERMDGRSNGRTVGRSSLTFDECKLQSKLELRL